MADRTEATFSPVRGVALFTVISLGLVGLIGRVAYLQTYGRQSEILRAERQHHQSAPLPARRGSIFDTNGALIACTIQNQGVYVDPKFMHERYQAEDRFPQMDVDVAKLADLLDRDSLELSKLIADNSEERYLKLSDGVDERTAQEIEKLKIPGIGMMPVNQRVYPMGQFASHIIGGVGKDQNGLEGIELKYDKVLKGRDGFQRTLKDARRRAIGVAEEDYVAPVHGQHLVLTIDANIQSIAEKELNQACLDNKAKRGEVVVLDPWTGDVLALANYPTFSPQTINEATPEARTDNALVSPYEPGSAMKPFIVGPALQQGIVTWDHIWPINGLSWRTPYGRAITDTHGYGPLAMWDVLVKSSNIGMSMLAERMENPKLYAAISSFRFGKQTGIELPGETPGVLHSLERWTSHSTESVAQGYELEVTPLQLARAFCVYSNGGHLPQIRIVKGTVDVDGSVIISRQPPSVSALPQVVSPEAAGKIRRILADVPLRGTASTIKAKCPNWYVWNIYGKTGTAHISEGKAGYSAHRYNSTFLGAAPYEHPRLVIAMTIHDPGTAVHYGGAVSGPPAARILTSALTYLQVDPSPELPPPPPEVASHLVRYDPKIYKKPTTQPSDKDKPAAATAD